MKLQLDGVEVPWPTNIVVEVEGEDDIAPGLNIVITGGKLIIVGVDSSKGYAIHLSNPLGIVLRGQEEYESDSV